MKLSRIRIEQFRQFRQPVQLDGLEPGINLFTGPNEAGKSTIAAAIRAAFFQRHRSTSVEDLRPWGDSAAAPTVEIDFSAGGVAYRLVKTFLARKRCELQAGPRRLDGADAEDHLAQLLGFTHASRGASKAEEWGIPGLLWIEQGGAHDLAKPVEHAIGHLRHALNESIGDVASSEGDDLLDQVEAARNELLKPRQGDPRGIHADALALQASLTAELAATAADIAQHRHAVDRLAALRAEHSADEAESPWIALRLQEAEALEQHEAAQGIAAQLASARQRASELDALVSLRRDQAHAFVQHQTDADARHARAVAAEQAAAVKADAVRLWRQARLDAAARCDHTRQQLREARDADARRTVNAQLETLGARTRELATQLERAEREQAALAAAQRAAAATELPADALPTLHAQQRHIRELQIQQAAAATVVRFSLDDGVALQIGGDTVQGQGERRLVDVTTVMLPGLGRIEIAPGGSDLPELRRREQALCDAQAALLQRLGVQSVDDAQARHQSHAGHIADARAATATLQGLAPQGIDALRTDHDTLQRRWVDLQSQAALPCVAGGAPALPVAQAEAEDDAARESLAHAEKQLGQSELQAAHAQASLEAAQQEHAAALAVLNAPERLQRLAAAHTALTEARAEQLAHAAHLGALNNRLEQARPEILAQDVARLKRSAEQLEKQFNDRREQLLRLDAELQVVGAQGLEERHAELARDLAQAERRAGELGQRAAALDHLLQLLKAKRRALTRKLQAPLQRHLQHYLTLLFPQASVDIDEQLTPGPLTRPGPRGPQAGPLDALSFGAREQMGVISRLAYADLLKEAGRPTLIILDDALVHSDEQRLSLMKRALFDAATRHQILLFTCHPAKWRDIGVTPRPLPPLQAS